MPFSLLSDIPRTLYSGITDDITDSTIKNQSSTGSLQDVLDRVGSDGLVMDSTSNTSESLVKEHSTTNIQVENVDEADITKTDGNYIYSISEDKVIITNVMNPENIKIEAKIEPTDDYIPEDIILYNNKLVVISENYISYNKSNTFVNVYDIT